MGLIEDQVESIKAESSRRVTAEEEDSGVWEVLAERVKFYEVQDVEMLLDELGDDIDLSELLSDRLDMSVFLPESGLVNRAAAVLAFQKQLVYNILNQKLLHSDTPIG